MKTAISDLYGGYQNSPLWVMLGWKDLRLRYKRTILGPFWQTLSMALFVTVLGVLYSQMWRTNVAAFLPYLATGMSVWLFFSSALTEGCGVFVSNSGFIKLKGMPYSTFVFRLLFRNSLVFLHNLPVVFIVLYIFEFPITVTMLLAIPGLALVALNCFWMATLLGVLCTRFRDISNLVTSLVQIMFFTTPVFWNPDLIQGKRRAIFVESNPVYHLIEVVRAPLLGKEPDLKSWLVVAGIAVIGYLIMLIVYGRFRSRIPYWV